MIHVTLRYDDVQDDVPRVERHRAEVRHAEALGHALGAAARASGALTKPARWNGRTVGRCRTLLPANARTAALCFCEQGAHCG